MNKREKKMFVIPRIDFFEIETFFITAHNRNDRDFVKLPYLEPALTLMPPV